MPVSLGLKSSLQHHFQQYLTPPRLTSLRRCSFVPRRTYSTRVFPLVENRLPFLGTASSRGLAASVHAAAKLQQRSAAAAKQQLSMDPSKNALVADVPALGDQAIPLRFQAGAVTLAGSTEVLLDAVHRTATGRQLHGGVVIGVSAPSGPVSLLDLKIGQVKCKKMLACARNKLWWMTPEWTSSTYSLPPEVQFLLLELEHGGPYGVLLPLIDGEFRATLRPIKRNEGIDGELVLRLESGCDTVVGSRWDSSLYLAASWDPYELVDRAVAVAAALSGGAQPRTKKEMPPSLDAFGWCTWDAFYSTVSARGLQEGLASLGAGGIHPRLLIIDDGWQMTDVDPPFRKPPTTDLADKLHVEGEARRMIEQTQDEFVFESQEVLAETAMHLEPGMADTVMPTLTHMGASHHPSTDSLAATASQQDKGVDGKGSSGTASGALVPKSTEEAIFIVRLGQKIAGWLLGLASAAFLIFYQWVVEPAPPGSLAVRGFEAATRGFLKPMMLSFYATASDFTRRLTSVKANSKFSHPDAGPDADWSEQPAALGAVVAHIKKKFNVRYVYCWHGLPGYWAGVMPDAQETAGFSSKIYYARPTAGVLEVEPSMAWNPAVLAGIGVVEDPSKLYNAMHSYLYNSGIDGVKVDCQAGVGLIGSAVGGGATLSASYHVALEGSVRRHFPGNHCINCMCHSTENLYRMTGTAIARASDDFYPRDPASSHPHIAACAYNSVFLGALLQPDWDMFHSKHQAARLHAMARAISGGAVYVSDKPGEHDFQLLHRLVLPDGTILRCRQPGRPTRDCLFADVLRDGKSLLKVWNLNAVNGVVGVFHLQGASWDRSRRKFFRHNTTPAPLSAEVHPADVDTFRSASTAAGSHHQQQQVPASTSSSSGGNGGAATDMQAHQAQRYALYGVEAKRLVVVDNGASSGFKVTLRNGEAEMVVVAPVMAKQGISFAPIGITDYINAGGAVLSCSAEAGPSPPPASVTGGSGKAASRAIMVAGVEGDAAAGQQQVAFSMRVKGCGEMLAYSSARPTQVLFNGTPVAEVAWSSTGGCLTFDVPMVSDLENEVKVVFS